MCRRTDTGPDYTRRTLPRRTRALVHHCMNQSRDEVRDVLLSDEYGAATSGAGGCIPRVLDPGSDRGHEAVHFPDAALWKPEHSTSKFLD